MSYTIYAFEPETGATARSAQRCTHQYIEDASQLASRFMAKNPLARLALPGLRKEGA